MPLLDLLLLSCGTWYLSECLGHRRDRREAIKKGAYDFLSKPVDSDHLLHLLARALERRRLEMENLLLREESADRLGLPRIVGEHPALRSLTEELRKVAATDATVLLQGESGTGKELFARAIHHLSPRKDAPFVAINCAAIPETLLESELFGHEKGAFTGADSRRTGRFEQAAGGTLLLDEVGDLSQALQAKLLRVLEERVVERVGGAGDSDRSRRRRGFGGRRSGACADGTGVQAAAAAR